MASIEVRQRQRLMRLDVNRSLVVSLGESTRPMRLATKGPHTCSTLRGQRPAFLLTAPPRAPALRGDAAQVPGDPVPLPAGGLPPGCARTPAVPSVQAFCPYLGGGVGHTAVTRRAVGATRATGTAFRAYPARSTR